MQTSDTPNTPFYWKVFYAIQNLILKEFPNKPLTQVSDVAHKLSSAPYELLTKDSTWEP